MNIDSRQPIAEITRALPAAARVFERLGIDYCCQGKRSLSEACAQRGLDLAQVVAQLAAAPSVAEDAAPTDDIVKLIDYIEEKHHVFTRTELARLAPLADKVKRVHGEGHPDTVAAHHLLRALTDDLLPHMLKEERVLFPYMRRLALRQATDAPFITVQAPIAVMHADHEDVGSLLEELAAATNEYQPPQGACASYRALYHGLSELQEDIHRHVHLENNVLFPWAVRLEQEGAC